MDYFQYKNGEYYAEDVALSRIAQEIGTPFYCYSAATLTRHYQVFAETFAALKPQPRICFAVKANPNLAVLATLGKLGCGADVVSEGEIRLAMAAAISPERIVFSGVGKTKEEMAFALKQNIFQFNVESEGELRALSEVAAALGKTAPVALRVNPDVAPATHAKISTGGKETKFGVSMAQAPALYALAASLPGIAVRGVSVHIGSQLTELEPFALAFKRVRSFVDELRAAGHAIHTVDLGGGLGIPYNKNKAAPPLPAAYGELVKREMAGVDAQLIFEPGRMMAGNAGVLVTRVIYVKQNGARNFIIVDAGMNDLIRPTLYEAYHEIVPVQQRAGAKEIAADVVGPVCETGDIFAEGRTLPQPQPGDLLAFRSAGAYGASMASTYNARPLVAEVMVQGDRWAVTRPRQKYDEIIMAYRIPCWL